MTGFATRRGQGASHAWAWEVRSVNGKGLDLRLRLPDGIDGLEVAVRAALGQVAQRGNVSIMLRLTRDAGETGLRLDPAGLRAALSALAEVEAAAMASGVTLGQATQADVLKMRGVLVDGAAEGDASALLAAMLRDLPPLLADFDAVRRSEGAALAASLTATLDRIGALTAAAATAAAARESAVSTQLQTDVARLLTTADALDPARLAQELALIAVRTSVAEEVDRLTAHVQAARALLASPGPQGRKLDFLTQEFLREANTLCAKAQDLALTRIGLDLKSGIDQMREQAQNVE